MYVVQDEDQSTEVVAAADIVAQRVLPDPLVGTPVRIYCPRMPHPTA
jgi:hypothetical protein